MENKKEPIVSIIIPVYNAEKSIRRCIDSVLNQEYKELELLLVDDGSTDSSGEICEEYAAADDRVRIFHKENAGVSAARNLGLDYARGEYLQFLDSDDWITADATSLLVRSAKETNCDMVISDFYRVVGNRVSHKGDIDEHGLLSREAFAGHMMKNPADFYYGVLWNKLFRREIVEKWQMRMNCDISWCEDFMFNLEYIRHAETFYALQVPVYYYVKTKGSLVSQSVNPMRVIKMKSMIFAYYNDLYKDIFDEEEYEKIRLQVYKFFIEAAGDGTVPLSIFPSSKKLGYERSQVNREIMEGGGALMDIYRDRKLLEHYLEPVALKYDLALCDVILAFYLSQKPNIKGRKKLSDFTGMPRSRVTLSLKKLSGRGFIKKEDSLNIIWLSDAQKLLEDLAMAQRDYEQAKFAGFSEDELIQYEYLSNKIKKNVQNLL